ncbi:catalase [Roseococcus microcysteis]|uniref:catalase n=1 Tax=Roseococcus microcysteis TaxID=2771361 RepID=UPI00168B3BE9|nr:catalase [Roseococcus microcysteis]
MAQRPLPAMPRRGPAAPAARGRLVVTGDITCLTRARLFAERGKATPLWLRLPAEGEAVFPPAPLTLTLHTEDGPWELPLRRLPVEFLRRPDQRAAMGEAVTQGPAALWEFCAHHPPTLHAILHGFADAAWPRSWRAAPFFGAEAYALERDGRQLWCRLHLVPLQGEGPAEGLDPRALFGALTPEAPARWRLCVQIMSEAEAREAPFDAFDATRLWPSVRWPLIEVGIVALEGRLDIAPRLAARPALPGMALAPRAPRRPGAGEPPAGAFYRGLEGAERARLMDRLAAALHGLPEATTRRLLDLFTAADAELGAGLLRRLRPRPFLRAAE